MIDKDKRLHALREDLQREERILTVKRQVVRELGRLKDDTTRRRVMIAVAALCGYYDEAPS